MSESIRGAFQRYAAKKENYQDNIRESGRDIDHFSRRSNALYHTQINEYPGHDEGKGNFPVECFRSVDVLRYRQGRSVPEILGWAAYLKFKIDNFNLS